MSSSLSKKLVVVGDGGVGKTCLLLVFASGEFPIHYLPTVFEHHQKTIIIDNKKVTLELWDTAGQEEYSRLRPLAYPDANVILLCCSVDLPDSLYNIKSLWLPEILHFCPTTTQMILVVNKVDLRNNEQTLTNLSFSDQYPLQKIQCEIVANEIGASAVIECSARRGLGVQEVFEVATKLALGIHNGNSNSKYTIKRNKQKKCQIL